MLNIDLYSRFKEDPKLIKRIAFLEIEWRRAYPLVDLEKQLGWSHVWLISNNKRYSDMARYLNNWFKRCQVDLERAYGSESPIQMPKPRNDFEKYKKLDAEYQEDMSLDELKAIKEANMRRTA